VQVRPPPQRVLSLSGEEFCIPVTTYLYLAQIVTSVAIIVLVLLQAKDAGIGGMFGGGDMGVYRTRRGPEKTLFNATIALSILFAVLSLSAVMYPKIFPK
jgi:preprotein translocase subunit SecG